MDEHRFAIVFSKLKEAQAQEGVDHSSQVTVNYTDASISEAREIDELRRFVLEVADARPVLFTRS